MISVIVPVYNAENTLRQCVDSILSQQYEDLELILIDDGSTDNSPRICDDYSNVDSRVIIIHERNAGVSAARNKGLEIAKGEWICFVDSDDYVSKDFLNYVASCKHQLLITGFRDEINGKVLENVKMSSALYSTTEEVSSFIRTMILNSMVLRGPWGKFYRRGLLGNQRFNTEMKIGEDTCFVFDYLQKCSTLEVNASSFYIIRRGIISDEVKYKSSVNYAVLSLGFVWEAFKRMERKHKVGSRCFYTFLGYYKLMCKHEWKHNLPRWYRNPQVHRIYNYVFGYQLTFINVKYRILRLASFFL